jgi:hypothetical protein
MKRLASFFIVCLLCWGNTSCKRNIDSGLVAYYPFNGNASDQSGNGNHGVVDGATLTSDRFGNENSAYRFDGINDNILAGVKNMPAIESPQSFSWWFKIDTIPTYIDEWGADNMIALVDTGKGVGIQFGFRAPGYNSLGFDTWNWGGGTLLEVERPEQKKWHHCVYTYDGSTHRFYINGIEIKKSTAKTQQDIPTLLMFGNYPSGDQFFEGQMDDIRVYNRTLKQPDMLNLYNERN